MGAYDFIRDAIIQGEFEPGQRLTEEFLSAQFRLSRTPIREAIRQLETEGLVVAQGRGVAVKQFSATEVRQIYDARALLEGYVAGQAAILADESQIEHLFDIANRMYEVPGCPHFSREQTTELLTLNWELHNEILMVCQNEYLRLLVSKMMVLSLIFRSFYWRSSDEIVLSMHDHMVVVESIRTRDFHRARAAMEEHIFRVRDQVLQNLSKPKME